MKNGLWNEMKQEKSYDRLIRREAYGCPKGNVRSCKSLVALASLIGYCVAILVLV